MYKNKFLLFLYAATTRVLIDLVGRLMLAEIIDKQQTMRLNEPKLKQLYKTLIK